MLGFPVPRKFSSVLGFWWMCWWYSLLHVIAVSLSEKGNRWDKTKITPVSPLCIETFHNGSPGMPTTSFRYFYTNPSVCGSFLYARRICCYCGGHFTLSLLLPPFRDQTFHLATSNQWNGMKTCCVTGVHLSSVQRNLNWCLRQLISNPTPLIFLYIPLVVSLQSQ